MFAARDSPLGFMFFLARGPATCHEVTLPALWLLLNKNVIMNATQYRIGFLVMGIRAIAYLWIDLCRRLSGHFLRHAKKSTGSSILVKRFFLFDAL